MGSVRLEMRVFGYEQEGGEIKENKENERRKHDFEAVDRWHVARVAKAISLLPIFVH